MSQLEEGKTATEERNDEETGLVPKLAERTSIPTSQIPGLSLNLSMEPNEKSTGRQRGILDTDSTYVKLAKRGGQKGLLWHEETNLETKPHFTYKPPDWFNMSPDENGPISPTKRTVPDYMSYEEFKQSEKTPVQPLDTPFGSDNKSVWERETDTVTATETVSIVAEEIEGLALTAGEANKFKKKSCEKRSAPVSMAKLLSFGYAEEG